MNALETAHEAWSAAALQAAVDAAADSLRARGVGVVATLLDNGAEWIVADRAIAAAGLVHLPLPAFFTHQQRLHAMRSAGAGLLWTTAPWAASLPQPLAAVHTEPALQSIAESPLQPVWLELPWAGAGLRMPPGTAKITFTSGSTGQPKGVCLSAASMEAVARGIADATATLDLSRHLSALPYPVLLENIAGLLAPMERGATCIALPLAQVGLTGSSSFDPALLQAAVLAHAPHSLILLPQMLRAWTAWLRASGQRAPASLRLVAVGGAAVGAPLLEAARELGLPAHEGYGLSEGASVQTLNLPGADRPGSAGRALPHARLRIAVDGEIELGGALHLGYLGSDAPVPQWWPSGDLGEIDADGFLHVQGRKKQVLITAFGRNVSPEWVECELHAATVRGMPAVVQAVVLGDGEPSLSAVLWPLSPELTDAALQAAVDAANARLPDYAQVRHWVRSTHPFTAESGLATANGRPRRDAIAERHAARLRVTAAA
jgi:long-chain acyl-CoA synthetase